MFRGLQSGEITADDLGELSVGDFLDMISRMEGMVDQAADAASGGKTESFQVFKGVTEITANRIQGTLSSILIVLEDRIHGELTAIRRAVGGSVPASGDAPSAPPPSPAGGGATVHREGDSQVTNINVPVEIHGADVSDEARIADVISGKVVRRLDKELGRLQRNETRRQGRA